MHDFLESCDRRLLLVRTSRRKAYVERDEVFRFTQVLCSFLNGFSSCRFCRVLCFPPYGWLASAGIGAFGEIALYYSFCTAVPASISKSEV